MNQRNLWLLLTYFVFQVIERIWYGSSEAGLALPKIASRIYGLTDAISENETGLFHDPGDVEGIEKQS